MIARDSLVASVLAATDKVVQQVSAGDWKAAQRTSEDRRALLEQLAKEAPQDGEHGFLRALREAAAESDAALVAMHRSPVGSSPVSSSSASPAAGSRLCTKA